MWHVKFRTGWSEEAKGSALFSLVVTGSRYHWLHSSVGEVTVQTLRAEAADNGVSPAEVQPLASSLHLFSTSTRTSLFPLG